jgi:hypothetical protein
MKLAPGDRSAALLPRDDEHVEASSVDYKKRSTAMNARKLFEFIERESSKQGVSYVQLAARAGVPYDASLKTPSSERLGDMGLETIDKLAGALGYEIRVAVLKKHVPPGRSQGKLEAA